MKQAVSTSRKHVRYSDGIFDLLPSHPKRIKPLSQTIITVLLGPPGATPRSAGIRFSIAEKTSPVKMHQPKHIKRGAGYQRSTDRSILDKGLDIKEVPACKRCILIHIDRKVTNRSGRAHGKANFLSSVSEWWRFCPNATTHMSTCAHTTQAPVHSVFV